MASLKEQRLALLDAAKAVFDAADADGRDLTLAENTRVKGVLDEVEAVDARIKRANEGEALLKRLGGIAPDQELPDDGASSVVPGAAKGYLATGPGASRKMAERLVRQVAGKSLLSAGSVATGVEVNPVSPITAGKLPLSVLDLLPVVRHGSPTFRWLRQTTRTNAAAVVAAGDLKPTSTYTFESVDDALQVVAHLSQPMDRYQLADVPTLQTVIDSELQYGLYRALEREVLLGDGTAGHLTGALSTSGIQVQAFGTDRVGTIRSAITRLENVGFNASAIVLRPDDWEAIETARTTTGEFVIEAGPVDSARKQLWGTQVVISNQLTTGTAVVLDTSALALNTDSLGVELRWTDSGDLFNHNQLQARFEGRFGVSVYRPLGIVKATLA